MIEGANRNESPRGRIMSERVGELWATGLHSTYEIAKLCRIHEAEVCRILRDRRVMGCVS